MPKRRTRGEGSTFQDKHGQWWAKVPFGQGRVRRARATSRKEAEAILKSLLKDRDDYRLDLGSSQQSVQAWLEQWIAAKQSTVSPRTLEFYKRHCEYMLPYIGKVRLENLEARHVRQMLQSLQGKLSDQSLHHIRGVLRNALNMALRERLVRENVAKLVDAPKVQPYEAVLLTPKEIDLLRKQATGHRWAILLDILLILGLRRGEVITLLWSDWDRSNQFIKIRNSKTASGIRILPLSTDLQESLEQLWVERQEERRMTQWREHGLIFTTSYGGPIDPRNINRWLDRQVRAAGIMRHVRVHDLRHTAISDWFAVGADPRAAQELAGHASPVTTQRIYAKARPERMRDIIDATSLIRKKKTS